MRITNGENKIRKSMKKRTHEDKMKMIKSMKIK
jgi:hypothetical protein